MAQEVKIVMRSLTRWICDWCGEEAHQTTFPTTWLRHDKRLHWNRDVTEREDLCPECSEAMAKAAMKFEQEIRKAKFSRRKKTDKKRKEIESKILEIAEAKGLTKRGKKLTGTVVNYGE